MSDDDDEWTDELAAARIAQGRRGAPVSPFAVAGEERKVNCVDCKTPIAISAFAWEVAKQASEMLIAKGQAPLRNDEMSRCEPCGEVWRAERLGLFERFCDYANKAQHDANTRGVVDENLVQMLRKHGYNGWADGIAEGAARFNATQATKGRAHKERK